MHMSVCPCVCMSAEFDDQEIIIWYSNGGVSVCLSVCLLDIGRRSK